MRKALSTIAALAVVATGLLVDSGTALAAAGEITEYYIPSFSADPEGIAAGPDGNLWFTERSFSKVGRVTPSGAFIEYTNPNSDPASGDGWAITSGPDGNLWYTQLGHNRVTKLTTSGTFTDYSVPTTSGGPFGIATGPDGKLWFTENGANKVAKVTTSGSFTEYPITTAGSGAKYIAAGPDGNLWFTENAVNQVAKVTTAGVVTEYPIPTANSHPFGIAAGPDGNLWFTETSANQVAKVTTSGTITEYPIPTASSGPLAMTAGPDGNLWFVEGSANNVAKVTTAGAITEYPIPTSASGPNGIAAGPDGYVWFTEFNANQVAKIRTGPGTCITETSVPANMSVTSTKQYSLANSDGATWRDVDATKLRLPCTVSSGQQAALLTANADLFTGKAGYNQDLGIFVSDNGGADQLLAWKESGGFAGTFSPNAAYVQYLFNMTYHHTYVFKLKWKTNKNAPGATIYAGAGSGPYSPTSLTAATYGTFATSEQFAVSNTQYILAGSDGATWQTIDGTNLSESIHAFSDAITVLGANADLFTGSAGYNQDLGIFVSDNGGPDTLVAWKESGGFAGTFSPNAAFVKATYGMAASHDYVFKLKWKTNKPAPGVTIYAGAGNGPYSPTSLFSFKGAVVIGVQSTNQNSLSNSNGATWQVLDASLNTHIGSGPDLNTIIGANADLFTANAGYNQDIGIFVSVDSGVDVLLAWKESGGFAGTFSPNAAYVQTSYLMVAGHTYDFKVKWKTNKNAPGATIYAGAGGPAPFSPTRLTIELTN
jgi:streptogramin lyase